MVTKTYIRNSGRLGPITVQISGRDARVYSAIGSKSYSFEKLPLNYDNRCSILRLAVKHYFDEILDACQAVKNIKEQTPASRIMSFFLSKPQLPNGSGVQDMLCCEIHKNYKKYNWEQLDEFVEYKGTESAVETLQHPPVVAFVGFDKEYYGCGDYLHVDKSSLVNLELGLPSSTIEQTNKCIESFMAGEVSFYLKMLGYKKFFGSAELPESCSYFYEIVDTHKFLLESYVSKFGKNFIDVLFVDQLNELEACGAIVTRSEKDCYEGHPSELTILGLSELLIERYDLFMPYKSFMGWYEGVMEANEVSIEIRDCFTAIIQKITGYSQIVKSFLKHDISLPVRMLYIKFTRFSAFLNEVAERTYLENEEKRVLATCKGIPSHLGTLNFKLFGCITNLQYKTYTVHIYIFGREIYFFVGSYQHSTNISLDLVNIHIFDKKMFIFLELNLLKGQLFQTVDHTKLSYGVFQFDNRETAVEFRNNFYALKYDARQRDGIYCRSVENEYTKILVSNVSKSDTSPASENSQNPRSEYSVKIEYSDSQISPISQCTKSEMFVQIRSLHAAKNTAFEKTENFLLKQRILVENISEARLASFTVFSYNEDNVLYSGKMAVFNELTSAVCRGASVGAKEVAFLNEKQVVASNYKVTNSPDTEREQFFNSILYEDDILKTYCPGSITDYLSQYILVLHSGSTAPSVISRLPTTYISVIFCIFLQRNLYTFLSPTDISSISRCIELRCFEKIISSVSLRNRCNIENIFLAACSMRITNPVLARLLIRMISPPSTPDDVLEKILSSAKVSGSF